MYNDFIEQLNLTGDMMILTKENAHTAYTISKIQSPELGIKRFNHNVNSCNGKSWSTYGSGSNSAVLFESEYKYWKIESTNN